ncbi:sterile alpha motif domain-containing protein 3-like isoform X2 [Ornithodoros turicata]|uniref:sterile alpha motif domain-containing protein 3-like isoform X2 n=1 Tax=Ornithodoros turicata TaxID=34597 RepID=UPI00313A296F
MTNRNDIEDRDGKAYDLPDFGWLHGSLLMVANGEPLTSSLEIKIVEFLYQSVMPFTLYPSRVFYYKVISLFLERYPHLADSIGSGFSSWLVALRNKFKNERRKVQNHEQVQQNRAKFASKRSGTDAEQPSELRRTQRESDVHTASQHEDETSIERHEQWLRSEGKKTDPDEFQIKVRMAATHRSRAADLATLPVTVTVVKYPYIMASGRFFNEFESATSKEALQPVQRGVEEVIRLTVSGIIRTGSPLQEKAKHIPHLEDVGATRKKHMLAVAALNILGCSLRETSALSHLFVHENVDPMPMIPCVRFTGDSLDEAQHMYLHVDGTRLFRVMDAEEGIAAIFAAYWIFQAQYGKEVTNVMTFIERQWYKLHSTKAKQQVIKLVSKVVRATT